MAELDCTLVINIIIVIILIWVVWKMFKKDEPHRRYTRHHRSRPAVYDDRIVLYFSSSTCGHCRRFNPTWDEFVETVGGQIQTQKIVCNNPENREICSWARDNLELGGVPHVVMVDPTTQQKIVFKGERTVEELVRFATQQ